MNYILLDAATMRDDIDKAKELNPNHQSLYIGIKAQQLEAVAPYLFTITPGSDFFHWVVNHPYRNKWGILLHSSDEFKKVWQHFRKFLIVKTEEGKKLYFRFYDPRVLPSFLATCDIQQLQQFFGNIQSFLYHDEKGTGKVISLYNQKLVIV